MAEPRRKRKNALDYIASGTRTQAVSNRSLSLGASLHRADDTFFMLRVRRSRLISRHLISRCAKVIENVKHRVWTRRQVVLTLASAAAGGTVLWNVVVNELDPVDPAASRSIPFVPDYRAPDGSPHLRVFSFGDSGTGGSGQREIARAIAVRMDRDPAQFLLLLGDNFYPSGVQTPTDRQWEDCVVQPYEGLGIPIYASLGNHDYNGDPDAQIARSTIDERWRLPARYYTFSRTLLDGTTIQFFVLDTTPILRGLDGVEMQLRWLEDELSRSRADWKIAAGHHPMITNVEVADPGRFAELLPLFSRHGVALYLAGHAHVLKALVPRQGVMQVVSGAGGGMDNAKKVEWGDDTEFAATRGGFTILTIERRAITIEFVRPNGRTQFLREILRG